MQRMHSGALRLTRCVVLLALLASSLLPFSACSREAVQARTCSVERHARIASPNSLRPSVHKHARSLNQPMDVVR